MIGMGLPILTGKVVVSEEGIYAVGPPTSRPGPAEIPVSPYASNQ